MFNKNIFKGYIGILIVLNVIIFLLVTILIGLLKNISPETIYSFVAIKPSNILSGKYLWTIITHMFMHANFTHLFVNMLSLVFIGSFVEKLVGRKRFLFVYFLGGIIAAAFFVVLSALTGSGLNTFAVGASGAIFALGGLLAVLTPRLPVLVFFVIPMPMWIAMIFLLGAMWLISITFSVPIGNISHLGGLLVGVFYGLYLKKKYPRKTKMIARYFS